MNDTGFEFIPLTIMLGIIGMWAYIFLSGSISSFKEKKIIIGLICLFMSIFYVAGVAFIISEIYIAWLIIGIPVILVLLYKNLDEDKKDILKGIFGWFCIILIGYCIWLSFTPQ